MKEDDNQEEIDKLKAEIGNWKNKHKDTKSELREVSDELD